MIGKVLRSGGSVRGLVRYLFSHGDENERHVNPRIIGAYDDDSASLTPETLVGMLDATTKAAGSAADDRAVYHLILASARADEKAGLPADKPLSDAEWASVAEDSLRRVGLVGNGPGRDCRWAAVRHDEPGAEHVHVVATLATEDGRRVHPRNDYYRVGDACRAAEERHDLRRTAPRDRTSVPPTTKAEKERAAKRGKPEASRDVLRREVRTAAATSRSESEFFDRLRARGVMVTTRLSTQDGAVTGYAVGLPGDDGVTFSGGKLAPDLTLPKLRARWSGGEASPPADPVGRAIRAVQAGDPDAAWAAGDYVRAVAGRRPGPLDQAAVDLDRAAREPHGGVPRPSAAGGGLRASSVLLAASSAIPDKDTRQLVASLALLAEAVAALRARQGRPHQAQAAQRAAQHLHQHHAQQAARTAPRALQHDVPTVVRAANAMRGRSR